MPELQLGCPRFKRSDEGHRDASGEHTTVCKDALISSNKLGWLSAPI